MPMKEEQTTQVEVPQAIQQEAVQEEATKPIVDSSLTFGDIQNVLQILDYAADQGAFKGWNTIRQVLPVRDKLAEFVNSVVGRQVAATPAPQPEQPAE